MTRIIPWTLPPVKGGSIGGYTPQPTPTPVSNDPYDLSDMVVGGSFSVVKDYLSKAGGYEYGVIAFLDISGVQILNTAEVASVVAEVTVSGNAVIQFTNGATATKTITERSYSVSVSSIMTAAGGSARIYTGYTPSVGYTLTNVVDVLQGSEGLDAKDVKSTLGAASTLTLEVSKITVYNSNGVALQEWVPE